MSEVQQILSAALNAEHSAVFAYTLVGLVKSEWLWREGTDEDIELVMKLVDELHQAVIVSKLSKKE
jgi:hypothetical protein